MSPTRKLLLVALGAAVCVYWVTGVRQRIQEQAEQEANAREAAEQAEAREAAIRDMVNRTAAHTDWTSTLDAFDPPLTVTLERLWLDHPILFSGTLADIASRPPAHYRVVVEDAGLALRVVLRAHRSLIDPLLDDSVLARGCRVATVAQITRVRGTRIVDIDDLSARIIDDGDFVYLPHADVIDNIRVGYGELIELLPDTPRRTLWRGATPVWKRILEE